MKLHQIVSICLLFLASMNQAASQTAFTAQSGVTVITLDDSALHNMGMLVDLVTRTDSLGAPDSLGFIQVPKGKGQFQIHNARPALDSNFSIAHVGGFVLTKQASVLRLNGFVLAATPDGKTGQIFPASSNIPILVFDLANLRFEAGLNALILDTTDLKLSDAGASNLQSHDLAGKVIGRISFNTTATIKNAATQPSGSSPQLGDKPDLTFCALDSLGQFGRQGDLVGLSLSTTSWNVGNQRLDWYAYPSWRHPFIIRNLYRITDEKIEQIGESGVKHGFFALSDSQCGGGCSDPTDGKQLGVNCTDTYNAFTTADQSSLGPRYEIDPWTGFFDPQQSHLKHRHSHDKVQHLLRVHDSDLNPASSYVVEAYYVHFQDANPMNNAAWKPVRVVSGNGGGQWSFDMTPEQSAPNIGFAIDAWNGAVRSVIAQDNPPVKGHSQDGRLLVACKVRDLHNGLWRYEYAIFNVDLSRGLNLLRVPVPSTVNISDISFHASEHEADELDVEDGIQIDNAQWRMQRLTNSLTWDTKTNPLRWGTLYNFGFTADKPPTSVQADFGLFKQAVGLPSGLTGTLQAPDSQ
jgi:hypothetical protein